MAGKREKRNSRLKRNLGLGILLLAVGSLLVMSGMIPRAAGNDETVSTESMDESIVELLSIPQPGTGIVPLALPGEERPPEEEEDPDVPEPAPPDPEKPMIALTFDDGPGDYTERLLEILRQNGVKATFFVIGRNIVGREAVLQKTAEDGHEIGSHSWNHPQLVKLKEDAILEQVTKTRNKISEVTGSDAVLMRPPYGAHNKLVRTVTAEQGVALINWSVDPKDWQLRDSEKVYQAVMSRVKDGDIILCHDIHETTVDAMERMIPELLAQGYQLVTVSELLTCRGGEIAPGTVYLKGEGAVP